MTSRLRAHTRIWGCRPRRPSPGPSVPPEARRIRVGLVSNLMRPPTFTHRQPPDHPRPTLSGVSPLQRVLTRPLHTRAYGSPMRRRAPDVARTSWPRCPLDPYDVAMPIEPVPLLIYALAFIRVVYLVTLDEITEPARDRLLGWLDDRPGTLGAFLAKLVTCPWCARLRSVSRHIPSSSSSGLRDAGRPP